jgi:hypothetical protein
MFNEWLGFPLFMWEVLYTNLSLETTSADYKTTIIHGFRESLQENLWQGLRFGHEHFHVPSKSLFIDHPIT